MVNLDPVPSVLNLQEEHRSEDVWKGVGADKVLSCREHLFSLSRDWVVDDRMLHYVRQAGFYGVHRLRCSVGIDRALITALVERWRQETHTFHLVVGEATITLEDVAVLTGLRVHGDAVIGSTAYEWSGLVEELLGVKPEVDEETQKPVLVGSGLTLSWLRRNFSHLSPDADDLTVQRFTRAYILMIMGSVLFADKSGDSVQLLYLPLLRDLEKAGTYSWGSATLAFLYRELCRASRRGTKQIGGLVLLLQLWSWEHIHIGVPTISRLRQPMDPSEGEPDSQSVLGSQHEQGLDPLACR